MSIPKAVELSHLVRRYDGQGGVVDVSLSVPQGAIYGLIGSNGAGKTTTLKVLTGLLFTRQGELRLYGQTILLDRYSRRSGIGFVPDTPVLDDDLNAWQWASFVAGIKRVSWPDDASEKSDRLLLKPEDLERPIRTLSFGTQRKIALWVEFLTTRSLLVLDEPLSGLDPEAIAGFHELAREFVRSGATILMSSHLLHEAEALVTHIAIIDAGKTLAEGTLDEIRGQGTLMKAFLERRVV